jgi:hypothetical protein
MNRDSNKVTPWLDLRKKVITESVSPLRLLAGVWLSPPAVKAAVYETFREKTCAITKLSRDQIFNSEFASLRNLIKPNCTHCRKSQWLRNDKRLCLQNVCEAILAASQHFVCEFVKLKNCLLINSNAKFCMTMGIVCEWCYCDAGKVDFDGKLSKFTAMIINKKAKNYISQKYPNKTQKKLRDVILSLTLTFNIKKLGECPYVYVSQCCGDELCWLAEHWLSVNLRINERSESWSLSTAQSVT